MSHVDADLYACAERGALRALGKKSMKEGVLKGGISRANRRWGQHGPIPKVWKNTVPEASESGVARSGVFFTITFFHTRSAMGPPRDALTCPLDWPNSQHWPNSIEICRNRPRTGQDSHLTDFGTHVDQLEFHKENLSPWPHLKFHSEDLCRRRRRRENANPPPRDAFNPPAPPTSGPSP